MLGPAGYHSSPWVLVQVARAVALSSRRIIVVVLAACVLAAGLVALRMNGQVDRALDVPVISERPVERVPVPERPPLAFWTSEDVEGFVPLPNGVWAAGAFGVARLFAPSDRVSGSIGCADISAALPTRRANAISSWRTDLVAGLDFEGLFVYHEGSWSEVRSGFGTLHVRALAETAAGGR